MSYDGYSLDCPTLAAISVGANTAALFRRRPAQNPVSFDCISKMPQGSIFPCVHPARSIGLLASLRVTLGTVRR